MKDYSHLPDPGSTKLDDDAQRIRCPDGSEACPLSFAQQRFWLTEQINGPSAAYTVPLTIRLTGTVDVDALRRAWADVVARHETLRTCFGDRDGAPYQRVYPASRVEVDLALCDVSEADLLGALAARAAHAFDFTRQPPWRLELFSLNQRQHVLVVLLHHIVMDGWSIAPLVRDFATAYTARRSGLPPRLPPLARRYADFVHWQLATLGPPGLPTGHLVRQLDYWRGALRGMPERLPLPLRPRPTAGSNQAGSVVGMLPAGLHADLIDFARTARATLFMVLHAAVAVTLTRFGAGDDIVVGCPVAGRPEPAYDDVVGPFVNMLVLRLDTGGDVGFRELVRRARTADLAAYVHQDVPFEQLVLALNPSRIAGQHPLFQVELIGHNLPRARGDFAGLRSEVELLGVASAKMDLAFHLTDRYREDGAPEGIEAAIVYSADVFTADAVRWLWDELAGLLEVALRLPDAPVRQLPVAPQTSY